MILQNQHLIADASYRIDSVISKDGTKIGYRQYGRGPGLVLVQGAMGTTYNYHQLAIALQNDFTVYVPERRGRRLSPKAFTSDYTIEREVEDLNSILEKTGSHFVFGLSSGAIITLESSRLLPVIHKAVVFEPPFYLDGVPTKKIAQFSNEVEENKPASALATALNIVKVGPPIFNFIPRPILKLLTGALLRIEDKKKAREYATEREVLPSMRYDFKVVLDRGNNLQSYKTVQTKILLLGGSKSSQYLKNNLLELEKILSNASRIEVKRVDHSAPWNAEKGGHPEIVAPFLINFFNEDTMRSAITSHK